MTTLNCRIFAIVLMVPAIFCSTNYIWNLIRRGYKRRLVDQPIGMSEVLLCASLIVLVLGLFATGMFMLLFHEHVVH